VGYDLRAHRKSVRVSQFRLARLLGVSSATLSAWETGKVTPPPQQLALAREALDRVEEHVEAGELERGRRPTPVTHRSPTPPGICTDCCADTRRLVQEPTAVALFAGCGGLALGFKQAGFDIVGFVELEVAARATFKRNFPTSVCLAHDVRDLDQMRLHASHLTFAPDILLGGPPCQGFSLAGKRDPADERNQLYKEYARCAQLLSPKVILMENVRLLMSMKDPDGAPVIDHITGELQGAGYKTAVFEMNAQDYGVPQFRERVFVVGVRADLSTSTGTLQRPTPSHSLVRREATLFGGETLPYVTFRDATDDLEPLESGEVSASDPLHWAVRHPSHVIDWLRDVPEGRSAHDNVDPAKRPPSGYNTTYKRLVWDVPCSTIGTTFGMISASRNVHPQYTRSLTIREAARCQTFPDTFEFEGSWGDIRTMIGNAVPPRLGEAWARHLVSWVLAGNSASEASTAQPV
jgi:DNA (cytosine-5)-methyltransferase 1